MTGPGAIDLSPPQRWATPADAAELAELVNAAGDGLPFHLWSKMALPGQSPWAVGRERACRESGSFSYRNSVVREADGKVAAALIGYRLADTPEPIPDDLPAMFVPLQQLEDLAAGSWYVNVLAAYPQYRGRGFGTELLGVAARLAAATAARGLSIIVSDANPNARRLYERCGYRTSATRPVVSEDRVNPGKNWILLQRGL